MAKLAKYDQEYYGRFDNLRVVSITALRQLPTSGTYDMESTNRLLDVANE